MAVEIEIQSIRGVGFWRWRHGSITCQICFQLHEVPCPSCSNNCIECPLINGTCGHYFHFHCLQKWFSSSSNNKTCPLCRQKFILNSSDSQNVFCTNNGQSMVSGSDEGTTNVNSGSSMAAYGSEMSSLSDLNFNLPTPMVDYNESMYSAQSIASNPVLGSEFETHSSVLRSRHDSGYLSQLSYNTPPMVHFILDSMSSNNVNNTLLDPLMNDHDMSSMNQQFDSFELNQRRSRRYSSSFVNTSSRSANLNPTYSDDFVTALNLSYESLN